MILLDDERQSSRHIKGDEWTKYLFVGLGAAVFLFQPSISDATVPRALTATVESEKVPDTYRAGSA